MVTLYDAESFTKYQFRVTAFLPDGQLANASTSDWISTLDRAFEPGPVGDIRATNASLRPDGLYLQTTISWEPAWEMLPMHH
ncbi:hypothetical protein L798_08123 [Zootermopsis nevadensis]|uniref:Fibronectin type-III domain-containing protein n=1 Tax=Zootermopsis nevadensis TaxID=136037 RepID=A0A067R5Z3_ZOONE|nr:hypothetical protein L798_08123 [Zootermopsis nevadensis]